jgi:hypothetical protein
MNFDYDELLKDADELLEFSDNFSFDEVYPITTSEIDINNYSEEPENASIKHVIMKIEEKNNEPHINPIKIQQTIPKKNAKVFKPQAINDEPKLTYTDILDRMGMFVSNGKLHLKENSNNNNVNNNHVNPYFTGDNTYSYIHNKYFKDYDNQDQQPINFQDPIEYRNYLIKQIIHNYKLKHQIKPKRIQIPGDNVSFNVSTNGQNSDLNKLFHFSNR